MVKDAMTHFETEPHSAQAALIVFRDRHDWTDADRDTALDRFIERFPNEHVIDAVLHRLDDLSGIDGEILLRLVEANPGSELPQALAIALETQTDLPIERLWGALEVLDGTGVLAEHALLQELWEELNESLDEAGSIEELAEQIENDQDGIWMALQGLGAVESDVRPQIIEGLAAIGGPGIVEFLRLLAYSDDPATRDSAISGLEIVDSGSDANAAWSDLASRHPEATVRSRAASHLLGTSSRLPAIKARSGAGAAIASPKIVHSMVSAVGGNGQATIAVASTLGDRLASAVFVCDVISGVISVQGTLTEARSANAIAFETMAGETEGEVLVDVHPLALALLSGCLTLSNPATSPALRYWVEATVGADLKPNPFRAEFPDWNPSGIPFSEVPGRAREVLDQCPDWVDESPLTTQLAEEIRLREGESTPDPKRDAGAYRYLFEHRLADQLELYRRMLLWMAWFWRAGGEVELGKSALALAVQLSDAQHVVPGHPFTVALTTRSLTAASRKGSQLGREERP